MSELDEIRGRLEQEISGAKNLQATPPNESCTCEWVIRPLLESAGYAKHEIVAQSGTSGGGIPDYTILPDTQWTWYLEAKAWDKNLENGTDAVQALNYANAQGKRWVVLSNGRQWLLFDNYLTQVEAPQRVVAKADLHDEEFIDFMLALSKPWVTEGRLEQFVVTSRVRRELDKQLKDKNSEVVKAITNVLRKRITGVQPSDVADYFSRITSPPTAPPPRSTENEVPASGEGVAKQEEDVYTLEDLQKILKQLPNSRPEEVYFPDGSTANANYWSDVLQRIVKHLWEQGKLSQIPYSPRGDGKRWLINSEPVHPDGTRMFWPKKIGTGTEKIYLEIQRNTKSVVPALCKLCQDVGEPLSGFKVKVRLPKPPDGK